MRDWTTWQVRQWLCWAIKEFSLDGLDLSNFSLTGRQLLDLDREEFLARCPYYVGDILWEHLDILQKGRSGALMRTCSVY